MSGRRLAALVTVAGAIAIFASKDEAPPAPANPLASEAALLLDDIYDAGAWSLDVPVEWAKPLLLRAGLQAWLASLELPPEVAARVDARVDAQGFVDELVPFALFVKDMYDGGTGEDFAGWARANVRPDATGAEHALFSFAPSPSLGMAGPGMDATLAARLVVLYDAVYLRDSAAGAAMGERLSCGDARLPDRAAAAAPTVRELLESLRDGSDGDVRAAVDSVLTRPDVLDTVTLSLIDFVDGEACKHHRMFAARIHRERQLAAWGEAQLANGGTELWSWLRWSRERPRAVHVVVDGLQGHLVRALAHGKAGDPFLEFVIGETVARPAHAEPAPEVAESSIRELAALGGSSLPFLRGIVDGPGIARQGISTTPTISVRNLPIAKTGAGVTGPGGSGIPNFHFVDRATDRGWYFYGNDALQLTRLTSQAGMRTMFARLEHRVTMSCGAQYDEAAGFGFDSFLALAIGEKVRDFGERLCVSELAARVANERRLAELRDALLARETVLATPHRPWEWYDRWQARNEREQAGRMITELAALEPVGMPDYLLWYDPWPDHFAHAHGPFSDAIVGPTGELARLDYWLARITATYADAGVLDRTLFGMAGDHGLSSIRWIVQPEREVLEPLRLSTRKISSDEGEGPKLTHPLRPPTMKGVDVVVASTAGGNYMLDFFVEDFARQPVLAQLRALRTLDGRTLDIPGELVRRLADSLDYLVVRETPCGPEGGTIRVMRAGAEASIARSGEMIRVSGDDVFDLEHPSPDGVPAPADLLARCVADGCIEADWRRLTAGTIRPDSVVQLAHLYDTDRAGTINLFPRAGVGYNTRVPGRHAGESFHEKDAFVGVWGVPVDAGTPPVQVAVNGSVPRELYRWLTGEEGAGWGYPAMGVVP